MLKNKNSQVGLKKLSMSTTFNMQQTTALKFAIFSKITNMARYFMTIVCWQMILIKYHTFFRKLGMLQNLLSAAVMIGALRVKHL